MQEERFEILLSRMITGELDAREQSELERLMDAVPRGARRYLDVRETVDFLDALGPDTLEIPELDAGYGVDEFSLKRSSRFARVFLPAAAALLMALGSWYYWTAGGPPETNALVTHAEGECYSGPRSIADGQTLPVDRLRSGANSTCDLRINFAGSVLVRLMPDSEIDFEVVGRSLNVSLRAGEALVHARRHPGEGVIRVHSPGHLVEVLGTKFALNRRQQARFHLDLLHGRARVRSAHYLHVHGLRNGLADEHREELAREHPEFFQETEHFVEAGAHLRVEHPPAYHAAAAPLFEELHRHAAGSDGDHTGVHRVDGERAERLKAALRDHAHLDHHFKAGPPQPITAPLAADRAARLLKSFNHAAERAARHD